MGGGGGGVGGGAGGVWRGAGGVWRGAGRVWRRVALLLLRTGDRGGDGLLLRLLLRLRHLEPLRLRARVRARVG